MGKKHPNNKREINLVVIVMVAVTLILAIIMAAFVFGLGPPFIIKTEEVQNGDYLLVRTLSPRDKAPIPNVTINVYEYGGGRRLYGPETTNESGCAIVQIPNGYSEHFDIVGDYKGLTVTYTVDERSRLVVWGEDVGPLGTALIGSLIVLIGAPLIGRYLKRNS